MDKEELLKNIKSYIGRIEERDIPCCEDSISNYDSYNNIDSMYDRGSIETTGLRVIEINDIESLALKLGVDCVKLNDMYRFNDLPSKGLILGILIVLDYDLDSIIEILSKLKYNLGNDVKDKIIKYFIINDIRDLDLLNEVLLSYGQMYLYSKKRLK